MWWDRRVNKMQFFITSDVALAVAFWLFAVLSWFYTVVTFGVVLCSVVLLLLLFHGVLCCGFFLWHCDFFLLPLGFWS